VGTSAGLYSRSEGASCFSADSQLMCSWKQDPASMPTENGRHRNTEPNTYNPNVKGSFLEPILGVDSRDLSTQTLPVYHHHILLLKVVKMQLITLELQNKTVQKLFEDTTG